MVRASLTLTAILMALGVNTWSNLRPIQGQTVGDVANTVFAAVLIIPANYAFAIWGLIYIGLLALGIYQWLPPQRRSATLDRVGYSLIAASLAQMAWIVCFQVGWYWASVGAMTLILVPLLLAYTGLAARQDRASPAWRWCVQRPLSLYLAWISVATITNVAIALFASNWNGWGLDPAIWTMLMLGVATALAAWVSAQHQDAVFTGVYVWALIAIAIANDGPIFGVAIGLAMVLVLFDWAWRRQLRAAR